MWNNGFFPPIISIANALKWFSLRMISTESKSNHSTLNAMYSIWCLYATPLINVSQKGIMALKKNVTVVKREITHFIKKKPSRFVLSYLGILMEFSNNNSNFRMIFTQFHSILTYKMMKHSRKRAFHVENQWKKSFLETPTNLYLVIIDLHEKIVCIFQSYETSYIDNVFF